MFCFFLEIMEKIMGLRSNVRMNCGQRKHSVFLLSKDYMEEREVVHMKNKLYPLSRTF